MPTSVTPAAKKPGDLTLRQRKFVQALPLASSGTEAAIRAGYSPTGQIPTVEASRQLRKANVQAAIAELQAKTEGVAIATIVERKTKLTEVLRKPVPDDVPVQAIISASDQLNRMESVYVDRSMSLNANIDLTELDGFSLDELKALLAKTGKRETKT